MSYYKIRKIYCNFETKSKLLRYEKIILCRFSAGSRYRVFNG